MSKLDFHVRSILVDENTFIGLKPEEQDIPTFKDIKNSLPRPFWQGHQSTIDCYYKTWEIAFGNLEKPLRGSGLITNFIDTAFNDCIFMWDSAFMLMFGRYADRIFDFQKTLNNFYAKQHEDGFICREINKYSGDDAWYRFDPSSTGPNIFPWTEWDYYLSFNDFERLKRVFPVLLAYHRWLKKHRTWKDGTYWASGYSAGMDNQPRLDKVYSPQFDNGHMSWADTSFQQIYSGKILTKMAELLGRGEEIPDINEEIKCITQIANEKMWDDEQSFYFDIDRYGKRTDVKSIGAYWSLVAEIVPQDRLKSFVSHLNNTNEFKTPHRVPSLSRDNPSYDTTGNYWRGGVWTLVNYMVMKGLDLNGYQELAFDIASNHLSNVVAVYEKTGTLWEAYSPEEAAPAKVYGRMVKDNFVGFSGLTPISVLFEYVLGIRPDAKENKIIWDVRLSEEHGVSNYPFKEDGIVNLKCEARRSEYEKPVIKASSNVPLCLELRWKDNRDTLYIGPQPEKRQVFGAAQ